MCNLYSHISNRQAILEFTKAMEVAEIVGNLEPQTGIFPDYAAPIVRNFGGVRQLTKCDGVYRRVPEPCLRMPKKRAAKLEGKGGVVDFNELLKHEPDSGTTNVRNIYDAEATDGRWQ